MNQQTMPNVTLFDLLARLWQRQTAVTGLCFNADDTLLAISTADGTLALARLADNEPAEARIAVESGQTTIRPRQGKPSPLIKTRVERTTGLSAGPEGGFLALTDGGDLLRLNSGGEIAGRIMGDKSPIRAFAYCETTGLTVAAVGDLLRLQGRQARAVSELGLGNRSTDKVALSGDGALLALAGGGRLSLRPATAPHETLCDIALAHRPLALAWSPDGKRLACGLEQGGLCLIDGETGETVTLADFPGSVGSIGWSGAAGALFASGAYRIAGWTMAEPPLPLGSGGALVTGRAGFVMVAAVAAHPSRKLVAAGYVNGRVVIASTGSSEEMTVRDGGGPVTTLQWSADGRHLAIGDALGSAAILTLPDAIFK